MGNVGRPKTKDVVRTKFTRTYGPDADGVISIWKFDLSKCKHGPISTREVFPAGYVHPGQAVVVPRHKRKFKDPKSGKMVTYVTAIKRGIIKSVR